MLLDKGYYDYDYERPKGHYERRRETDEQRAARTQNMMDRFGFGKVKSVKDVLRASELQSEVMTEGK